MRPACEATESLFAGDRDGEKKSKPFAIFFHLFNPLSPSAQAEVVVLVSHCIRITCCVLRQLMFNSF